MTKIISLPVLNDNYIWLIVNLKNQCIIIDPGVSDPVIHFIEQRQLEPIALLITHHHHDHTAGVTELAKRYHKLQIYGHCSSLFSKTHGQRYHSVYDEQQLQINDEFSQLKVLSLEGHTLDHMAFIYENHCFCGDTLFSAGCGRLFEGSAQQMYHSLCKLKQLPKDTLFYPAHEYTYNNLRFALQVEPNNPAIHQQLALANRCQQQGIPSLPSTLITELACNPFLRCEQATIKASVETHCYQECSNENSVFEQLRLWKDRF